MYWICDGAEVYIGGTWKWLSAKWFYALSDYFSLPGAKGSHYLDISATYDLGSGWGVVGHIGRFKSKGWDAGTYASDIDYTDWKLGVTKDGMPNDGLHDSPGITLNMMLTDPKSVRWDERVKAGKATINGVSIADREKNLTLAKEIIDFRAIVTVEAIRKAIANKGTLPAPPRQRNAPPER